MNGIPPDQFRRLFEYEQEAHRRVLDSLRRAESDHHDDTELAEAVGLAAHIATCRDMWLRRICRRSPLPETLFPRGVKIGK